SLLSKTKTFVKNNPQILFTHVDKDNVIVVLDRIDFIQKMKTLFADSETYTNLKRNPVNKAITELKAFLKSWKHYGFVPDSCYKYLKNISNMTILENAFFNNKFYKQTYGISMSSSLFSIAVDIVMQDESFSFLYPNFHKKNLNLVIKILLNNGYLLLNNDYPIDFIFNTINKRLKSLVDIIKDFDVNLAFIGLKKVENIDFEILDNILKSSIIDEVQKLKEINAALVSDIALKHQLVVKDKLYKNLKETNIVSVLDIEANFDLDESILKDVLLIMKGKSQSMTEIERATVFCFDKIYL
ncbi:hypothetical protein ALC56_01690, partial [Trachymyrmex septentrionalis]